MNYCNCPNCRTDNCPNAVGDEAEGAASVRSSEIIRDSEPRYSKMELIRAVNACCTCGGGGPGEKHTCPACEVYHALATVPNADLKHSRE